MTANEAIPRTLKDFPPQHDGKRFHVRTLNGEWQIYGSGLLHVCLCSRPEIADAVAEALEAAALSPQVMELPAKGEALAAAFDRVKEEAVAYQEWELAAAIVALKKRLPPAPASDGGQVCATCGGPFGRCNCGDMPVPDSPPQPTGKERLSEADRQHAVYGPPPKSTRQEVKIPEGWLKRQIAETKAEVESWPKEFQAEPPSPTPSPAAEGEESFHIERIVNGKVSQYAVHHTAVDCFVEDLPAGGCRLFPFSDGWLRADKEPAHKDWLDPERADALNRRVNAADTLNSNQRIELASLRQRLAEAEREQARAVSEWNKADKAAHEAERKLAAVPGQRRGLQGSDAVLFCPREETAAARCDMPQSGEAAGENSEVDEEAS